MPTSLEQQAKIKLDELKQTLPDHTSEILKADEVIKSIIVDFKKVCEDGNIDNIIHDRLYEENARILAYVGKLSLAIFDIEDQLEEIYKMIYLHSSELGKKLWYSEYEKLHHPYSTLKRRCFAMFDNLDEEFERVNHCKPANWDFRMYRIVKDEDDE